MEGGVVVGGGDVGVGVGVGVVVFSLGVGDGGGPPVGLLVGDFPLSVQPIEPMDRIATMHAQIVNPSSFFIEANLA